MSYFGNLGPAVDEDPDNDEVSEIDDLETIYHQFELGEKIARTLNLEGIELRFTYDELLLGIKLLTELRAWREREFR